MEQALKILEPSQQESRRMHLSSLADHLSHAGVPPEEEASLIEALDFCTQEEKVDGCLQEIGICDRGLGATRLGTRLKTRPWTRLQDAPAGDAPEDAPVDAPAGRTFKRRL